MTATLVKPKPEKPPLIYKKDIEEFEQWKEEKADLDRRSRAIDKKIRARKRQLMEFVDAYKEGRVRAIMRSGFQLAIVLKAGSVKWAEEFENRLGIDLANELREEAPQREDLEVKHVTR